MTETSQRTRTRTSVFERLAGWSYRRRWWAILAWVVALAGVTVGSQAVGPDYRNDFSLPGTESQAALDALRAQAPAQANDSVQIVLQDPGGLAATATRERVEGMLAQVRALPGVAEVRSPYQDESAVSVDGSIGYATVTLAGQSQDVSTGDLQRMVDTAQAAEGGSLRVELAGDAFRSVEESEGPPAELVGLVAALLILVVMFGSLLAASLPLVIAIFAVSGSLGLVVLASHVSTVADFTPYVMILVGLGVGIDYALLVFARYRGELIAGASREQAVRTALDTAGRTVFFAGCTVIIALLGLVVLGLGSLQGLAVAVAATVLVTMIASLTLLPALLAIFGRRIERVVRRRAQRRPAAAEGAGWRRWAGFVQRRPWLAAVLPAAGVLALAVPALDMRLGFADAGNDPPESASRQGYDLLAEGFGPGFNGPLLVVVAGDGAAVTALQRTLAGTEGVAASFPTGKSTVVVMPQTAPQAEATTALVSRLREQTLPPLAEQTGATFLVGGRTAAAVDYADAVAGRMPLFVTVVVGLAAVLLLVVFRSLLIPVKAAVLNLLSIGASLGVITLVFQEGLLAGPLGIEPGPVEAFVPVMIFAIVFGLSMDYEIFLLSRMHEEWERHGEARAAIREGLARTGRVVTAAAAIMIVVFGAFLLSPDRMLKQFGLGLAVAIFVDAVVIRCLILPAIMQLLGWRAWWLPGPVARRLPRVALEHEPAPARESLPG
jgi:RND superfamily putative drug exporter